MTSVFLAHPGLQHSHQLALGLYEHGLLKQFISGTPVAKDKNEISFIIPKKYKNKVKVIDVPRGLRSHPVFFQVLQKASRFIPGSTRKRDYIHFIFHIFDFWISKKISRINPRVVVAYENSAYKTFLEAKKIGAKCILDATSIHHTAQVNLVGEIDSFYLKFINKRKDLEVELADLIITCSPLAADSYLKAGVDKKKIVSVMLGADLVELKNEVLIHNNPFHFVFAGGLRYLKSIDIIVSVFEKLNLEGLQFKLSFVGDDSGGDWTDKIKKLPNTTHYKHMPQSELLVFFQQCDCLLLPSRFDSFGMVAAEAMACGIPVIMSTHTGAKAMIEMFPESGWIVEPEFNSLFNCIKEKIINRDMLFNAKKQTKKTAEEFTWIAYRKRVSEVISTFMTT